MVGYPGRLFISTFLQEHTLQSISDPVLQLLFFERELHSEGGAAVVPPARHVVAAAVIANPFAGSGAADRAQLNALAELSERVGTTLAAMALARFPADCRPTAYGKAVIVGTDGEREHGAALIHASLGKPMRAGLGAGPALIPGVAKLGGPGASVDLAFGDANDAWNFDAMDSMEVCVPGSPAAGECVLFVGFGTSRANARVKKSA